MPLYHDLGKKWFDARIIGERYAIRTYIIRFCVQYCVCNLKMLRKSARPNSKI